MSQYSIGMKQRLAIARAILTRPEILILDEPINGLDPDGIIEIRRLIQELNKEHGITVIISSHILSEMELLADTVGIMKDGNMIQEISMKDIHEQNAAYIEIETDNAEKQDIYWMKFYKLSNFELYQMESFRCLIYQKWKRDQQCFDEIWYRCGKYPEKTEQLRRVLFKTTRRSLA